MVKFELSGEKDFKQIAALWNTCFQDSAETVRNFYDLTNPKIFVAREGAEILSMACTLDMGFVDEDGNVHPVAYLYAVCTAPAHCGKGLCKDLLNYVENTLKKQVEYLILVPSEASLYNFYDSLGYKTAFTHTCYEVSAEGTAKITKLKAEAYQNLRELQLYGNFLSYDLPLLRWQGVLGDLYRIETEDGIYCAAAQKQGEALQIKELLPDCPQAAAALAAFLHCRAARVCTLGESQPFGMAKATQGAKSPKAAYLGLAFD